MTIMRESWNYTDPTNNNHWTNFTDFNFDHHLDDFLEYSGGLCVLAKGAPVVTYAVVLMVLAILATIQNVFILTAMLKYNIFRTPSMLLLAILAVIDLLTGNFEFRVVNYSEISRILSQKSQKSPKKGKNPGKSRKDSQIPYDFRWSYLTFYLSSNQYFVEHRTECVLYSIYFGKKINSSLRMRGDPSQGMADSG